MTANGLHVVLEDKWDASKHTSLENSMAAMLKYLLSRVVTQVEYDEVVMMFPELWGHERRG
jgi:hypothetical protein